ncbi:MAG: TonB family protein, partial [Blastocatellia bacterium]
DWGLGAGGWEETVCGLFAAPASNPQSHKLTAEFQRYPSMFVRSFRILSVVVVMTLVSLATAAQDKAAGDKHDQDIGVRPIFVTSRVFQMKAKRGTYEAVNAQVFKMKTSSLAEYDKWVRAFGKTYPGFEVSLLRTEAKKVFRTSKPTTITLSKQPDGRALEVRMFGAQSPGDGTAPGTSLIPEVALHFAGSRTQKPITYAIQPMEVESGQTYFFASTDLKLGSTEYVSFVRPNAPPEKFDGNDIYLIFAFSVDLDTTTQPARYYDERQSYELQEKATKKPRPDVPAALREAGMGGAVRVQIEIAPDGKVTRADVHASNFPEMNVEAMTAARLWEFPVELFAQDKKTITGFLTFNFPTQAPAKKSSDTK